MALLQALMLPTKLSIIHCPGHQKSTSPVARGNNFTDQTSRAAALEDLPLASLPMFPAKPLNSLPPPKYSPDEITELSKNPTNSLTPEGYWRGPQGKLILPSEEGRTLLQQIHHTTHLSPKKLELLIQNLGVQFRGVKSLASEVGTDCTICQKVNAYAQKISPDKRLRENRPGVQWEVDLTEIRPRKYG